MMKFTLLLHLWSFMSLSKAFNITVNTQTSEGLLCPEVTTWTCMGITKDSLIRWWLEDKNGNLKQGYGLQHLGLNLKIGRNKMRRVSKEVYILSRTLVADAKELYDSGYRLKCGTFLTEETYNIMGLDIEVPSVPQISSVNLAYNSESGFLKELTVNTLRNVYTGQSCYYRRAAYFSTSISSNGDNVMKEITPLNGSVCSQLHCPIRFSFQQTTTYSFLTITIKAVDMFNQSRPITYTIPYVITAFQFELAHEDCGDFARCTTPPGVTAEGNNCTITYTDAHHMPTKLVAPVNQFVPLRTLDYESTYNMEAAIVKGKETVHQFKTYVTTKRSWKCVIPRSVLGGAAGAVAGAVALILLSLCALIIVCLCLLKKKRKKLPQARTRQRGSPLLLPLSLIEQEEMASYHQLQHDYSPYSEKDRDPSFTNRDTSFTNRDTEMYDELNIRTFHVTVANMTRK